MNSLQMIDTHSKTRSASTSVLPSGKRLLNLFCALTAGMYMAVFSSLHPVPAQDATQTQPKANPQQADTESSGLPKLDSMQVPTMDVLLKQKPVDWIVLNNQDVIVAQPVYPRPNTLAEMQKRIDESRNWPRPISETERIDQRNQREQLRHLSVLLPESAGDSSEYLLPMNQIKTVIHHEDLILRRVKLFRQEEKYQAAFDLLFNLGQKYPKWPGLAEEQNHLILAEAGTRLKIGKPHSALVFLEQLYERKSDFPGLEQKTGEVTDRLIAEAAQANDYRRARFYLDRMSRPFPSHAVPKKWSGTFLKEAAALMTLAERDSKAGRHDAAVASIEKAANIWPLTPKLQGTHSRITKRFQTLRVGVLRLPGDPSSYPLPGDAEQRRTSLTQKKLFEISHIDRIPFYQSQFFQQWLPTDLGRQAVFTIRHGRSYWESHPEITAHSIASTLAARIDPDSSEYDERLASFVETVTVDSPLQFRLQFSKVPLRTETLFHFPATENDSTGKIRIASRYFQEHRKDPNQVSYRRYVAEPDGVPTYHAAEVLEQKFSSHNRAMQGLLRGEIDLLPHLQLWDVDRIKGDDRFYVQQYAKPSTHVLLFNPKSKALRDREFRRALVYAIDRSTILKETVLKDANLKYGRLTTAPFPTTSYAYNPLVTPREYDLTQAFSLSIAARGQLEIEKLPDLKMVCVPDPVAEAAAARLIKDWAQIGLKVTLVKGNTPPGDWDILYRTTRMVEPVTELWPFLTLESRARVQSLLHLPDWLRQELIALDSTSDWNAAYATLKRLHHLLLDEVEIIPLWEVDDFMVIRKNVAGFPLKPIHTYQSIEQWKVNSWYPKDAR